MRRKTSKKLWIFGASLLTLAILSGLTYTMTMALLSGKDKKQNEFRIGDFKTSIEEQFAESSEFFVDEEIQKQVSIKNIGEQSQFLRVLLFPMMIKNVNGSNIFLPVSFSGESPELSFSLNKDEWVYGEDGYFYYLNQLNSGETTTKPVLSNVTLNKSNILPMLLQDYENAELTIEVKVEAIGTTKWSYRDAFWNSEIPTQVNLKKVNDKLSELVTSEDIENITKK